MGVVLLTMTIGGLIIAAILLVFSLVTKRVWLRTFVLGGVTTWFAGYLILFFVGSFFSVENNLALNQPKEFCGFYFDCHLHAAVTNVRTAKTLGDKTANGEFYVVKVKISNDAKRAKLGLLAVNAKIIDARKNVYGRDTEAEANLDAQPPFERQISPSETFEKEIVFDLPPDAQNPRLDINEGYGIDRAVEAILVGDEDSFGHKRDYFQLMEQPQIARVK